MAEICVATIIMVLMISFELFAVFKLLTHKGKVSEITKIIFQKQRIFKIFNSAGGKKIPINF